MKRRSDSFIFTLKPENEFDRDLFAELRLIVQIFNQTENASYRLQRVGRLGENSEFASLYSSKFEGRTYSKIRVSDASRFDIYLNNRAIDYGPGCYAQRDQKAKLAGMLRNWASIRLNSLVCFATWLRFATAAN